MWESCDELDVEHLTSRTTAEIDSYKYEMSEPAEQGKVSASLFRMVVGRGPVG